jgi:hypothetical protein
MCNSAVKRKFLTEISLMFTRRAATLQDVMEAEKSARQEQPPVQ